MGLGVIFCLTSAFIWSTTSLLVKAQASRVDTLSFNAFRIVVGALFFVILLPAFGGVQLLTQLSPPTMLTLAASVLVGFCFGDSIYFWSMTKIGASRTMPISGVYPVFTWLIAVPLLGEEITLFAVVGTVLVVIALYLLGKEQPAEAIEANEMLITTQGDAAVLGAVPRTRYLAVGAAVLAALAWACSTTLLRLGIQMQAPVTMYDNLQQTVLVGVFRLTIAGLVMVPIVHWLKGAQVWSVYRGPMLPRLIAFGVYSTGIGSLFFVMGVALAGAARAALFNSASPLIGVVLSWLFLREPVTRRVWAGTALALLGVWLVLI